MTGLLFGAILLLTVACWAALGNEDARRPAIAFLAAAPFLLFSTIVILTFAFAPAGEYRVALEAVEIDLAANGEAVTVGGAADGEEADDLIVRDLPTRFLTFRVEGQRVVASLPNELDHAIENPAHAAVRIDDEKPFANSIAVKSGQAVRIGDMPTTVPSIPPRKQKITESLQVTILRNLNAETMMYPLRFWSRAGESDEVVTGPDGAPLGSFFSFDKGFFRKTLFLTFTGDGTTVGGARYQPRIAVIDSGAPRAFALFRLDFADPKLGDDRRSAAQERRSFRASYEKNRLSLVFDTPDIVRLAPERIVPLIADGAFLLATRDPRRDAPVVANQMVLSFPQLGPRVQNELFSVIRVSESGDCRVRVTSHTGTRCYASGEAFRVGDRAAAVLRVTEMSTPWGVIATLLVLAFFAFTWMRQRESDTIAIVIVSAAQVLLAVRLLIAFEGALLDPASAPAVWESLVIFALLPFALRAVWSGTLAFRPSNTPPLAAEQAEESEPPPTQPDEPGRFARLRESILLEGIAVLALITVALMRANIDAKWIAAVCAAVVLLPLGARWLANAVIDRIAALRWPFAAILAFALFIALLRVAMLFGLGWKERISLPGIELALTILYLPAVFVVFALLWQRYREFAMSEEAKLSWKHIAAGLVAAVVGALLTILIPWFVKDSGSALVHVPAIVLLFALPALARPDRISVPLAMPLVLVLAAHVVVSLMPHVRGQENVDPTFQKALNSEDDADQFMAERRGHSTNQLRILSHVAPHQLEQAGTSKAEGLVMQRRVLDRYGGTGLLGAGYLDVPLTMFRDTHMNDNLSAIHILAPFGIAGAIGVLTLLLALAFVPLRARFAKMEEKDLETPASAIDTRIALGILALWTFSLCSIYMIAANLGLVVFTGKNVYLLAASSNSDAIEGGLLLLIALVALAPPPPKPAAAKKPAQETPEATE
jgi:hypothetical protein